MSDVEDEAILHHYATRAELNEVFVGHTVTVVNDDTIRLNDGTLLQIVPNEGGWGCGCGSYDITELNGCDNIITGCKIVSQGNDDEGFVYRLYVYSGYTKVNLVTVNGHDGTGQYGTGFAIFVREKGQTHE